MIKTTSFSFHFIRTVSCLLIFTGHYGAWHNFAHFPRSTTIALSMFSLISAYLLTDRHPAFSWDFYAKRAVRIYPTLFVFTLLCALFIHLSKGFTPTYYIFINMLGLNALVGSKIASYGLGSGMWFVTFILIAYLLLPILCLLFDKFNPFAVQGVITIILGFVVVNFPWSNTPQDYVLFTESFTWFCAGIFYCKLKGVNTLLSAKWFIAGIFVLSWGGMFAIEFFTDNPWLLYASIAIVPYWAFPLLVEIGEYVQEISLLKKTTIFISTISFEMYLSHFYIIGNGFNRTVNPFCLGDTAFFPFSLFLTIIVSYLIWKLTSALRGQVFA